MKPAEFWVREDRYPTYACKHCEEETGEAGSGGSVGMGKWAEASNRAERSIKPFVMGRKNFLFCNTSDGAQCSAVLYSLIETAKETGLDP